MSEVAAPSVRPRRRSAASSPRSPSREKRGRTSRRIWLREIAEGAEHVDTGTLRYARDVLGALGAIIDEGRRAGRFQPANPLLIHAGIIAPLMFFLATAPVAPEAGSASAARGVGKISRDEAVAHIQRVTLAVLEGRIA